MSPLAAHVIDRLDAARQKWWLFSLLSTTVLAVCGSFAIFMAFALTDAFARLPQPWLVGLFAAWLLLSAVMVLSVGRRLLRGQRTLEASARRVEIEFPEVGSHLINLVQLAERSQGDPAFCASAIHQAAAQIEHLPFDKAPARESRWRRLIACMQTPRDLVESLFILAILFAATWLCATGVPSFASAASRLLAPWRFIPSVGTVEIVNVIPGNTQIPLAESLTISAEIKNPDAVAHRALLVIAPQGDPDTSQTMSADSTNRHFNATVAAVQKPFRYRLEIGDSQTPWYTVGLREKPKIEAIDVTFHYPAYLDRAQETRALKDLDLESPQFTVAELRLRVSTPITQGLLETPNERYPGRIDQDGRLLTASLPLLKNGSYVVRLFDDAGRTDSDPRPNRIAVLSDRTPVVEVLKPGRQLTVAPNSELPVVVRATDDHGIGRLQLEMRSEATAESADSASNAAALTTDRATVLARWTDLASGSTAVVRNHRLQLNPSLVKPGETVFLRAVAWDKRSINDWGLNLGPQEGASEWIAVKIVSDEASTAARLKLWEDLRAALRRLLEQQVAARVATTDALKKKPPTERVQALTNVRTQQGDIQSATADLVKSTPPSDEKEREAIKRVLNNLAFGDLHQAVVLCDQAIKAQAADELKQRGGDLTGCQDRVIAVLRKLLDVTRHAEVALMAEMQKRPGGDLPDDVKQKLEEIRNKLNKFLAQQKKIIEASENLAKTPVEDFTKEQEELLKQMAAAEDDWSKFMKEIQSDLSKLPEQDFSNPTLAKELIEIQVELKMAADALLKKSADIAVPLEQLGYERAEELKTNLEKWLPDAPDREKWSQEESLTDKDKEAPMAELPGELEDMVGELMEQEEALFDEMEDVSSSAADSLDKGAGWDAMDGPISNNSAKGVTGNRLPNTSEIGGRAGEGRQGKASGEFVGEDAIGKGGRNTPGRLTADPRVQGQIRDHSKQSAGGATGGGKESGKGGEGLEGPVSRKPGARDPQRLAGRQAELRNRAESIDLRMQVANYHHTDLSKMIEAMSRVERDLKAGRYQNALRQRHVLLEGLRNVKQYLQGEFEVRKDSTPNVPTDVQKKILGSMQDPSPAGWEGLNREYFERISGKPAAGASQQPPAGSGQPRSRDMKPGESKK